MTLVDEDIAAARQAVRTAERAVTALLRHYGDSVDGRRLRTDVERLGPDLDLLCGAARPAAATPAPPVVREVIPDSSYAHDFWMDAEDEGVGRYPGRSGR